MKTALAVVLLIYVLAARSDDLQRHHTVRFEGSEHRAAADAPMLYMIDVDAAGESPPRYAMRNYTQADPFVFVATNGVLLGSYGDLVGMAGDFFGAKEEKTVICDQATLDQRMLLFNAAFNDLYDSPKEEYVLAAKQLFDEEDTVVSAALAAGTDPYDAIKGLPESRFSDPVIVAGGFVTLLLFNYDHFEVCAAESYAAGHAQAVQYARRAGQALRANGGLQQQSQSEQARLLTGAIQQLSRAYAMNAAADHFLTDMFASGHVRCPREAIALACAAQSTNFASDFEALLNSGVTSQWMHDEDNRNGVYVRNARNDTWFSYGDASYFSARSGINRQIIQDALQASKDEVLRGFLGLPDVEPYALQLTPIQGTTSNINSTCPLYTVVDGTLMVRSPRDQTRPPLYYTLKGVSDPEGRTNPQQPNCDYIEFQVEFCAKAVSEKFANFSPEFSNFLSNTFGFQWKTPSLTYDPISDSYRSDFPYQVAAGASTAAILAVLGVFVVILLAAIVVTVVCLCRLCKKKGVLCFKSGGDGGATNEAVTSL